jgi:adenosylcobinamide-GDP ribazoletransferase
MRQTLQAALAAVQFLTRIPLRSRSAPDEAIIRRSLVFFPAVGLLIGAFAYTLARLLAGVTPLSPLTIAVVVAAAETLITGAFHLDGLADSFDAFGSPGTDAARKLEIMRDSRIGVMGAVAVTLALMLKVALLREAAAAGLFAAFLIYPAVGRWTQVALLATCTCARPGGIAASLGRSADGAALALASCWLLPWLIRAPGALALAAAALFLLGYRRYVHRLLGGITGDILGSATVMTELVFLATFVLLAAR